MKNIVLVQVVDAYGPNKFLPLAIGYQWLNACQHPDVAASWQLLDVLIDKQPIDSWLDGLAAAPDVVAMSCYVWNWKYNNQLAQKIKSRWPKCCVVIGGPQVDKHDVDLVRNHSWFDIAVLGENEAILQDVLLGQSIEQITALPGTITQLTQRIVQPSRTMTIDNIPSPILSGFYDDVITRYQTRYGPVETWQVTWETMRGCPYHCSFCDMADEYWNKTVWFDLDRIKAEIDWMSQHCIEFVGVCDSNWGIHPNDVQVTQMLIDAKLATGYPKMVDVTWAKNNPDRVKNIVAMDHSAGTDLFRAFNFSMQSLDARALQNVRRFNLQDSITREAMQFFQQNNVPIFTELIWPMPGETVSSFVAGLQKVIDLGQHDFLQVHPLVLTYNAPMAQERTSLGLESRTAPLDSFWLKLPSDIEYIVEEVDVVVSTGSATQEDNLHGHMIAHWLIVLYYYGWANTVMKWFRRQGQSELDFILDWINWCEQGPDLWIRQEHDEVKENIRSVFDHGHMWGRRVPGGGDVLWEYKSSTCVRLHYNRARWQQCLHNFLISKGVDRPDLEKLNHARCVDWREQYPLSVDLTTETAKDLGFDSNTLVLTHNDVYNIHSDELFVNKAYHWRRKNCYWRCQVDLEKTLCYN